MSTDRRNPHRPFEESLIHGFLRGRDVVSAELLTAGKINTNYKLALSDGGAYVLRLYSQGNAEREAYIMSLVKDLVPVPIEIDRGEGWSLFTFLEGDLLENVPEHTSAAAEALARISTVEFGSPGWVNVDGSVSSFPFGDGGGFIAQMLAHSDVLSWIGQAKADALSKIMENEKPRRDEINAQSRLVHGDFNPTNVLIHEGRVSGVLDWEFSHSGSPYMDIGNLLRNTAPAYHDHIEAGLKAGGMSLPSDWKERAELVDLGSHLEFLTSTRADSFKHLCVGRIERFIDTFG